MMVKKGKDFYPEIADLLRIHDKALFDEFSYMIKKKNPKEIYIWLEENIRNRNLSSDFQEVMADFFFSIY